MKEIKFTEKIEIYPVPYESVHQTCKMCSSPLRKGEKVLCRNCSSNQKEDGKYIN